MKSNIKKEYFNLYPDKINKIYKKQDKQTIIKLIKKHIELLDNDLSDVIFQPHSVIDILKTNDDLKLMKKLLIEQQNF